MVTRMTDGLSPCRDLKRDVAKKLEKLERRTQRAIAELIRQYSVPLVVAPDCRHLLHTLVFKHAEVSAVTC